MTDIDKNIFSCYTVEHSPCTWLSEPTQEFAKYMKVLTEACLLAKFNTVLVHITDYSIDDTIYLQDLVNIFNKLEIPDRYVCVGYYADGLRDFLTSVFTNSLQTVQTTFTPIQNKIFGCLTITDLHRYLCDIKPPREIDTHFPILIKVVLRLLHFTEQKLTILIEKSESHRVRVERGLIRAFAWTIILSGYNNSLTHGLFNEFDISTLSKRIEKSDT
jgi:hypothetical protein